ncbi:polysaccharide deacetylase family protein [Sutcliffiella sp. NPDC057660]|uniref:polysaccharide deacetylase family protein n=1 Tax=Sutcliffiella sp. NPDC057660 TaxID=3346199 RepID=UPI003697CDF9
MKSKMANSLFFVLFLFIFVQGACEKGELGIPPDEAESPSVEKEPSPINEIDPSILLDEILAMAQKGMIKESSFDVWQTTIDQVQKEWGKPEQVDRAGSGIYASFPEKKVTIGYRDDGEIFDIRSYARNLQEITLEMMEKKLGKPSEIRELENERIYVYRLEKQLEMKMVITNQTEGVDHLSVFNGERAKASEIEEERDYLLDIKGTSNQLSSKSWIDMQKWRKDIVSFSRDYDHIHINGPNKKMVALTFDDGPDNFVTPAILDVLKEYNVKGSFFYLGSEVEKHPDIVTRTYSEGHLVLSHSYHHLDLTTLTEEKLRNELEMAGNAVEEVIGREPAILRTPYGETNGMVADIAKEEGYSIVLWSIDTLDWSQKESENIVKNVFENVRNGDIILMHSDSEKKETAMALSIMIEELQERNFDIVDLENLLSIKAYKTDQ